MTSWHVRLRHWCIFKLARGDAVLLNVDVSGKVNFRGRHPHMAHTVLHLENFEDATVNGETIPEEVWRATGILTIEEPPAAVVSRGEYGVDYSYPTG